MMRAVHHSDPESGYLTFRCNICGQTCVKAFAELGRETPSCDKCGSTARLRTVIHLLSTELFGESVLLQEFPTRRDIRGIGLSDWEGYANQLAQKLDYSNSFYHTEPRLDITAIDPATEGTFDFIISSDVFEHVPPPISLAFTNTFRLLKPGGLLILTVPYTRLEKTLEHFPELHQYEIIERDGIRVLHNITRDGREQTFEKLAFHGGAGSTLEMRIFSKSSLLKELEDAGFREIRIHAENRLEYGIFWESDWSLPITAHR
jgi:SAM-dependent methyltransferase